MKVYININKDNKVTGRQIVEVELVKRLPMSYVVRLPDGNVILRKPHQVVTEDESKG